jgi:hypothetical protein
MTGVRDLIQIIEGAAQSRRWRFGGLLSMMSSAMVGCWARDVTSEWGLCGDNAQSSALTANC